MNAINKMEEIKTKAAESLKNDIDLYGFAHGEINGHSVTCRVELINTNSKRRQFTQVWWVDEKRSSKAKVAAL